MAALTFYPGPTTNSVVQVSPPSWFHPLTETAPAAAASGSAWTTGTIAARYLQLRAGATNTTVSTTSIIDAATGPLPGTAQSATAGGGSFRTWKPYRGTFDAGSWAFNFMLNPSITGPAGTLRMRIWKAASEAGTGATEITLSTNTFGPNTLTGAGVNNPINPSWSVPQIDLDNEFLFFTLEWLTSNTTSSTISIRTETNFVSTNFTPRANTKDFWFLNTTPAAVGFYGVLQDGGSPPSVLGSWGVNPGTTALATKAFYNLVAGSTTSTAGGAASQIESRSGPLAGTSGTAGGDSYRTPTALSGTFEDARWQILLYWYPFVLTVTGRWRMRVWKSANADGSAATDITSAGGYNRLMWSNDFTQTSVWTTAASPTITKSGYAGQSTAPTGYPGTRFQVAASAFSGLLQASAGTNGRGSVYARSLTGANQTLRYYTGTNTLVNFTITSVWQRFEWDVTDVNGWHIEAPSSAVDVEISSAQLSTTGVAGPTYRNTTYQRQATATAVQPVATTASTGSGTTPNTVSSFGNLSHMEWFPGSLTLNNEYLFFELEWNETTVGSAAGANTRLLAGRAGILTPALVSAAAPLVYRPMRTYLRR